MTSGKKESKYFSINQKSMADALVFLGFNYYKFNDDFYGKVYSFPNSEKLIKAIKALNKLKAEIKE